MADWNDEVLSVIRMYMHIMLSKDYHVSLSKLRPQNCVFIITIKLGNQVLTTDTIPTMEYIDSCPEFAR